MKALPVAVCAKWSLSATAGSVLKTAPRASLDLTRETVLTRYNLIQKPADAGRSASRGIELIPPRFVVARAATILARRQASAASSNEARRFKTRHDNSPATKPSPAPVVSTAVTGKGARGSNRPTYTPGRRASRALWLVAVVDHATDYPPHLFALCDLPGKAIPLQLP
jgi:hypothetical protein